MLNWQIIIQHFIEGAGNPQRIARVGRIQERGKEAPLEEASNYLSHLRPNSIRPLMDVSGEINHSKARRVLYDTICELGKNSVEIIAPFINDSRWYLVRNAIYIFHHSVNVAIYAIALRQRIGLSRKLLAHLGMAAMLHDIGKTKIPPEVLKPRIPNNSGNKDKAQAVHGTCPPRSQGEAFSLSPQGRIGHRFVPDWAPGFSLVSSFVAQYFLSSFSLAV